MHKSSVILVAMGGLVAGGLAMSMWGNQVLFDDFTKVDGMVGADQGLSVQVQMDGSRDGVFVVEMIGLEAGGGDVGEAYATVTDPGGAVLVMDPIRNGIHEGYFEVGMAGGYTLAIEYSGLQDEVTAVGYVGPQPEAEKRTIAFVSAYVLVIGLAGMLAAVAYAVISKRRQLR